MTVILLERLISVASAQLTEPPDVGLPTDELPELILSIINAALALVGILALAYLVYGGFLYITARGEESQIEQAKKILTYAVVGIVVIGVAAALVNFVIDALIEGAQ